MSPPIPILLYHRIDDSGDMHVTAPGEFERHLRLLYELGWHSLSAAEFAAIASREKSIPPRAFLITFDDGYESIRTAALAILQKFSFKAICFISTNMVKERPDAPISDISKRDSDLYLSWPQACELQASGMVDCQSHSHTHSRFGTFSLAEIEDDLVTSVDILAERLCVPRSHFVHLAWPWGLSLPEWRSMAARVGFQFQYSVARQAYRSGAALDQIPRTCFDSYGFGRFQREIWLQTGQLSPLWDSMYPYGRKARRMMKLLRGQGAQ